MLGKSLIYKMLSKDMYISSGFLSNYSGSARSKPHAIEDMIASTLVMEKEEIKFKIKYNRDLKYDW